MASISNAVELTPWPDVEPLADKLVALAANKRSLAPKVESAVATARNNTGGEWLKRRVGWVQELYEKGRKLIAPLAIVSTGWTEIMHHLSVVL